MRKLSLKELNRINPDTFKEMEKQPIALVLDNIRSALNVGSAFRTADALAFSHVYLCGITAQPPHREILKTAIGATESVSWTYFKEVADCLQHCKGEGYTLIGAEQTDQSIPLQEFQTRVGERYALVMGNEVRGISDAALRILDACVEIPQFGTKHSLNVSVATGIISWELFRKINYPS